MIFAKATRCCSPPLRVYIFLFSYHLVSALRCGADDGGVEDAHLHDAVDGLLHELVVRHLEGVVLEGTNL